MESSLQHSGNQPLELAELKQIIKNRFSFDRRKMIFFTLNSCLLGLALFSMFSAITLESNSQIFRIRSYLTLSSEKYVSSMNTRQAARTLETILIPQNMAQLCTIICGIIGYFGIYQKSRKVLNARIIMNIDRFCSCTRCLQALASPCVQQPQS